MKRRNFLKLVGLTALATIAKTEDIARLPNVPREFTFHSDGLIEVNYFQEDFNPVEATMDMGTLNPNAAEIDGFSFKRGELQYISLDAALQKGGYYETTYRFKYCAGGHNSTIVNDGEYFTIQEHEYAKGIESHSVKGIEG